jgi:hypothetical protein
MTGMPRKTSLRVIRRFMLNTPPHVFAARFTNILKFAQISNRSQQLPPSDSHSFVAIVLFESGPPHNLAIIPPVI